MRPLKLTISAFGSYAGVENIDFEKLGEVGLYLITGETGSGKTTIFDAISFALFGEASGKGRDRYAMLRSDFAQEKVKTYVELGFACGKLCYSIRRSIKRTGQEVILILPDGTAVSGTINVKSKISEIIGIDREQFAQIIMIAQNDFLRFLQSGTEDRRKILRRIFGTEVLRLFQERLKALAKSESDKLELVLYEFKRYEVDVYKRDEQFKEWENQIKADKSDLIELDKKLSEYNKLEKKLAGELAVAEELNKKFSNLAKLQKERGEFRSRANKAEEEKARAIRGEVALYKVKPLSDEAQKASVNQAAAYSSLVVAKELEITACAELEEAETAFKALPALIEAQEAYSALSKEWEIADKKLKGLVDLQANHSEIITKRIILAKKQEELSITLDLLSRLQPVENCRAELERIAADLNGAEEKLSKLSSAQDDFSFIKAKQAELSRKQSEFELVCISFAEASERHRVLEEAFLRNQAGIIAGTLKTGEPCPVCGSLEHPAPAEATKEGISETKLKDAGKAKDSEQAKREAQATVCSALKVEIETLTERFIAEIHLLISNITRETVSTLLPENISRTEAAILELSKQKKTSEQMFSKLMTDKENLTNKLNELTPILASLQSEIDTLANLFLSNFSKHVPTVKWESSESELNELLLTSRNISNELAARKEADKKALMILTLNADAAEKRKITAESGVRSAKTLAKERAVNEEKLSKHRDEANLAYKIALQENDFIDDLEYKAALITYDELDELKKRAADYEALGKQLTRDIDRLQNETAGKEPTNLEDLQREAETATLEFSALSEKRKGTNERKSQTEHLLTELRRAAADFDKIEKKYATVKQLADTADGNLSDRMDFETYAQIAYFGRVLSAANFRLRVMSHNRYTLLRKLNSDDRRRNFGLELEILDAYTGKARSTGSLSGGESFMTSLSLALGLSDIVQQNAGGIKLDAMFIDEGFGSLDADALELAIKTLSEMAGTNRIIGIISHVAELRERIDKQVQVEKTTAGSRISKIIAI